MIFRYSKQSLLTLLKNLGKAFGVKILKSIFPYKFVDEKKKNWVIYLLYWKIKLITWGNGTFTEWLALAYLSFSTLSSQQY